MEKEGKAMMVCCEHSFCIYNSDKKCTLDQIRLSTDGLCENSFDRTKLLIAERILKESI